MAIARTLRAAGRTATVVGLLTVGTALPAAAQDVADGTRDRPWIVSVSQWAKWGALASAVGFSAIAIFRNDDANDIFNSLVDFCAAAQGACVQGQDGRYVDAGAEVLYQETLRRDRQARLWMIAGQVALAAAGTMFLIDLVTGDDGPDNIPFSPFEVFSRGEQVGLRIRF